MKSKNSFRQSAYIKFADNEREFIQAVYKSPKNEYLLDGHDKGNVKFLYLSQSGNKAKKFFFAQVPDGEIVAASGFFIDKKNLYTVGVSVHPDYRNQKLASNIIKNVMEYANNRNIILKMTGFEPLGKKYLPSTITKLHSNFPNLKIEYNVFQGPVCGKQSYELKFGRYKYPAVKTLD